MKVELPQKMQKPGIQALVSYSVLDAKPVFLLHLGMGLVTAPKGGSAWVDWESRCGRRAILPLCGGGMGCFGYIHLY
jgi:hypothetical protein